MNNITQGERIMAVEVRVANLERKVDEVSAEVKEVNHKIDELLELKNKGVGAFWLISTLVGTGIVTAILTVFHYITGRPL